MPGQANADQGAAAVPDEPDPESGELRRDQAMRLIREGMDPTQIREAMGVALDTVLSHLDRQVGAGRLRRSDIYFSIAPELRKNPEGEFERILQRYQNGSAAYGDMYADLRTIEIGLHTGVRARLSLEYGPEETGWWREGVPQNIRVKCSSRREEHADGPAIPAYCFADLMDMWTIFDKAWGCLGEGLHSRYSLNKRNLKTAFLRLNDIRNRVMHPVRGMPPSEDDFDFVRGVLFDFDEWFAASPRPPTDR
jgi:hypothetical protein